MLVLTRKPGEKIHGGAGITITVTEVKGNKVQIGISLPHRKKFPSFRQIHETCGLFGIEAAVDGPVESRV